MQQVNKGTEAEMMALRRENQGLEDEESCDWPRSTVLPGEARL